jgi:hypothetical protein
MSETQTADRDGFSRTLPQPVVLADAETRQVAGGAEPNGPDTRPFHPPHSPS